MQDCLKVHADAKASQARQGVAKSSVQAASSCSRFHANSLKSLQRRIVAKKRKRRSIAPGAAEEDDSAASSCEVATMTFIEPQSQQAASFVWTDQAKRQC